MAAKRRLTTREVLGRVVAALHEADQGHHDLVTAADARRQFSGLKTMVVSGRATTAVLRKLKSREQRFDNWWAPFVREMEGDDLLRYFNKLRSEILKEGLPKDIRSELVFLRDGAIVATAEVAVGEDEFGIWVHGGLHDPSNAQAAEEAPERILRNIRLPDPPNEHLGQAIEDPAIDALGRLYVDYLRDRIVKPALEEFSDPPV